MLGSLEWSDGNGGGDDDGGLFISCTVVSNKTVSSSSSAIVGSGPAERDSNDTGAAFDGPADLPAPENVVLLFFAATCSLISRAFKAKALMYDQSSARR